MGRMVYSLLWVVQDFFLETVVSHSKTALAQECEIQRAHSHIILSRGYVRLATFRENAPKFHDFFQKGQLNMFCPTPQTPIP